MKLLWYLENYYPISCLLSPTCHISDNYVVTSSLTPPGRTAPLSPGPFCHLLYLRIEETGQALAKLMFKQVELMEIETENNNLWTWLSHGLTKIVDTLGETGTVICGFIFFGFLTLAVAGCAWKCWTSKSSSPAAHSPGLTSSCSCSCSCSTCSSHPLSSSQCKWTSKCS